MTVIYQGPGQGIAPPPPKVNQSESMEYASTGLGQPEQRGGSSSRPSFLEVISQESTRALLPSLLATVLQVQADRRGIYNDRLSFRASMMYGGSASLPLSYAQLKPTAWYGTGPVSLSASMASAESLPEGCR